MTTLSGKATAILAKYSEACLLAFVCATSPGGTTPLSFREDRHLAGPSDGRVTAVAGLYAHARDYRR